MPTKRIGELCRKYNYPARVEQLLVRALAAFAVIRPVAVALIGSAARGELSWVDTDQGLELLSDLEFAVFVNDPVPDQHLSRLNEQLSGIADEVAMQNPHFHFDWVILNTADVEKLPHNVAVFEMKANGKTLLGSVDELQRLPTVSEDSVNLAQVNFLVLVRLWWLLASVPRRIVTRNFTGFESLIFNYISCRNILDVPTIFLPNEGYLIPGYAQRATFLLENGGDLPGIRYMGSLFPAQIMEAVRAKQHLRFADRPSQQYRETVDAFASLLRYLLATPEDLPVKNLVDQLGSGGSSLDYGLLSRQRWRPLFYQFSQWLKCPSNTSFKRIFVPLEGRMIAALLSMHLALYHTLGEKDEAQATSWLLLAESYLQDLYAFESRTQEDTLEERWLALRYHVADALCDFYGVFKRRREFILQLLEWTDRSTTLVNEA